MAGETEVQGIALGLGLDITDWSAKIARAKQDLAGLRAAGQGLVFNTTLKGARVRPAGQEAYVPTVSPQFHVSKGAVSNLRVDINRELRQLAQTGEGVLVPVRLGRLPYAQMRAEISRGLGEIPITVRVANIVGRSRDPLTAVVSQSTGQTMGKSQASIDSALASKGVTKRASGGPVEGSRLFHGSPNPSLKMVSADPLARQFDNATSKFGAFATPSRSAAERYAGTTGRVYEVGTRPARPYQMSRKEFDYYQDPTKDARGLPVPGERWGDRLEELKAEAAALRRRLQDEGFDGISVPGNRGNPAEIASFRDISLKKRAEGGDVQGGLLARIRAREAAEAEGKQYLVGEKRPEVYVPKTGAPEIVGLHGPEVRTFPERGEIVPSVPEWVRRMKENAKDLTGRQAGGPVDPSMRRIQRRFKGGLQIVGDPGIATSLSGSLAQEMRQYQKELEYYQNLGSTTFAPPKRPGAYPPPTPPPAPVAPRPPDPYAASRRAAEERDEARLRARQRARAGQRELEAALPNQPITSFSQEEAALRRLNPALGARTPRTAVGAEALFRLGGGRERAALQNRLVEVDKYLGQFERSLGKGVDPIQHFNGLLEKNGRDLVESARATGLNSKATRDLIAIRKTEKSVLEEIKAHTAERGEILKKLEGSPTSLARGFLALQGTFAAYQLGVTAVSTAVELGVKALSPYVDALTGWSGAALKVGTDLSRSARELGGNVPASIAAAAGQAGVGTAGQRYLQQNLQPTITAQAAAQAAAEALDLRRAAFFAQTRQAGVPGLTGGPTGGIAGSGFGWQVFGGQESFSQTIARGIAEAMATENRGEGYYQGGGAGPPHRIPESEATDLQKALLGYVPPDPQKAQAASDRLAATLGDVNDATSRGAIYLGQQQSSLQLLTKEQLEARNALAGTDWETAAEQYKAAAKAAGDLDNATTLAANKVLLFDTATGKVVQSGEEYRKFLQQSAQGTLLEPESAFATRTARELQGFLKSIAFRGRTERNVALPGQFGLQMAAQPFSPAATGFSFVDEAERRAYGPTLARIDAQQRSLTASADAGLAVQRQFVQDWAPALVSQFDMAVGGVRQYGAEIATLNAEIANRQAALGAAQYGNNIRVLSRNLKDAQALTRPSGGRVAAGTDNLGAVNRAQFDLGRIAQQLSFALAQRQINFQTAVAGFQAPGITGQERAARLKEAQIEAGFAQRQLNIQRQQFTLEGTAFTIQARRAVVDAKAALDLEKQARDTQLFVLANEKRIAVAQLHLSRAQANATSILSEAAQNHEAILSVADARVKIFGGTIEGATNALRAVLGLGAVRTSLDRNGNIQTRTGYGSGPGGPPEFASGVMFDTKGPTTITAGEVAGEKVVVLKNPRQETFGSGALGPMAAGGGFHIGTILVTGNTISSDMDLEHIADKLADEVEDRLSRKAKLLGVNR